MALTAQKHYLQKQILELNNLKESVKAAEKKISVCDEEGEGVERELMKAQELYDRLKAIKDNYRVRSNTLTKLTLDISALIFLNLKNSSVLALWFCFSVLTFFKHIFTIHRSTVEIFSLGKFEVRRILENLKLCEVRVS